MLRKKIALLFFILIGIGLIFKSVLVRIELTPINILASAILGLITIFFIVGVRENYKSIK